MAFNGPISMLKRAKEVNILAAVSEEEEYMKQYARKERSVIMTGVVAQKKTHMASRYFTPMRRKYTKI